MQSSCANDQCQCEIALVSRVPLVVRIVRPCLNDRTDFHVLTRSIVV